MGCTTLAINGTSDHIHLFIKLPTTISVAELMKKIKGVSSRFINDNQFIEGTFKWSAGYGAFSVSRWDTERIKYYVIKQKTHHSSQMTILDLEETGFS
jgi:REP element-mobilizing transposase RayT